MTDAEILRAFRLGLDSHNLAVSLGGRHHVDEPRVLKALERARFNPTPRLPPPVPVKAFVPSAACAVCKWESIDPPAACLNERCGLRDKIKQRRQNIINRNGWDRS